MPEEFKEKKEFLKREEIKTMPKDIADLREIEAQKEKERITAIKTEEKVLEKQKVKTDEKVEDKQVLDTLIPKPLPKTLSILKKAIIRIVIIIFLLFISSFVWFLITRK